MANRGESKNAVLDLLSKNKVQEFTAKDVGEKLYVSICGGIGSPTQWAASILNRLAADGKVTRKGGGHGMTVFYSVAK